MAKNKKLRASQAHIWSTCSGSLDFDTVPDPLSSNDAASMGTLTHLFCEYVLGYLAKNKVEDSYLDDFIETLTTKDRILANSNRSILLDYCNFYLVSINFINMELIKQYDQIDFDVESFKSYKDIHGTSDLVLKCYNCSELQKIVIIDLKTGTIEVDAENNIQLSIYAHLQAMQCKQPPLLEAIIIQPPLRAESRCEIEYDPKFLDKLILETKGDLKLKTGTHCTYCNVNDICPKFRDQLGRFLYPKYKTSSIDRLEVWGEILPMAKALTKMADKVTSSAKEYLKLGHNIPNYELSYKKGRRSWLNSNSIKELLSKIKATGLKKKDITYESMFTPKQVEDLVKQLLKDKKITEKQCSNSIDHINSYSKQPQYPILKNIK